MIIKLKRQAQILQTTHSGDESFGGLNENFREGRMFFLHHTSVCFYVALSSVVLAREADKQSALHDSQVTRDTK